MTILRPIGYVGLLLLTAVVALSMYLSFTAGIERATAGAWLWALIALAASLLLTGAGYRAFLGRG